MIELYHPTVDQKRVGGNETLSGAFVGLNETAI